MSNVKKYTIFISSTYEDLMEERQHAMNVVLKRKKFPIGMELFKIEIQNAVFIKAKLTT